MSQPTARAAFLARVRAALGRASSVPITTPPELDESLIRLVANGPGLADTFARRAASSGMTVHRCTPLARWDAVIAILRSAAATRVVIDSPDPTFLVGRDQLQAAGISIIDRPAHAGMDTSFDAHAGITDVVAAVAETGSLVISSGPGRSRSAFIVPPIHIAIVREDQILADLIDLWPSIASPSRPPPPTALTLVSGPSKTADIEGILITGVHGPGAVHIVLESVPR